MSFVVYCHSTIPVVHSTVYTLLCTTIRESGFSGMEWWTGIVEWNDGLEWNSGQEWFFNLFLYLL